MSDLQPASVESRLAEAALLRGGQAFKFIHGAHARGLHERAIGSCAPVSLPILFHLHARMGSESPLQ